MKNKSAIWWFALGLSVWVFIHTLANTNWDSHHIMRELGSELFAQVFFLFKILAPVLVGIYVGKRVGAKHQDAAGWAAGIAALIVTMIVVVGISMQLPRSIAWRVEAMSGGDVDYSGSRR
jgi:hypothetical protein